MRGLDSFDEKIEAQVKRLCERVAAERLRQEHLWGRQNIHDLQKNSDGVHEIGRPYHAMEQIMKYQCDRARDRGTRSMDLVLLEEVFEALSKAVESADAMPGAVRDKINEELIEELIQTAAVCLKWAGIIERNEERHG